MPLKEVELKKLKQEIEKKIPNHWLFPKEDGVKGFHGTGKIMFIAKRPSSVNHGRDTWRESFYKVLKEFRLENSHLTDIIKSRATVNEPYPDNVNDDWKFLNREIKIIEPQLIFTLGKKVHNYLYFPLVERRIKAVRINHYTHAFRYNKVKEFKAQIRGALDSVKF